MNAKNNLTTFIDAIISGDEAVQKTSFSAYAEEKTREVLGIAGNSNANLYGTSKNVSESYKKLLEYKVDGDIEFTPSGVVLVKNRKLGKLIERGEPDELGVYPSTDFLAIDGTTSSIPTVTPEEVVKLIRREAKRLGFER